MPSILSRSRQRELEKHYRRMMMRIKRKAKKIEKAAGSSAAVMFRTAAVQMLKDGQDWETL